MPNTKKPPLYIYRAWIDDAYGPNVPLGTFSSRAKANKAFAQYRKNHGVLGQFLVSKVEVQ